MRRISDGNLKKKIINKQQIVFKTMKSFCWIVWVCGVEVRDKYSKGFEIENNETEIKIKKIRNESVNV